MPSRNTDAKSPQAGWSLLVPWLVLPVALAIITLVDWLRRRNQGARRADKTTGG